MSYVMLTAAHRRTRSADAGTGLWRETDHPCARNAAPHARKTLSSQARQASYNCGVTHPHLRHARVRGTLVSW